MVKVKCEKCRVEYNIAGPGKSFRCCAVTQLVKDRLIEEEGLVHLIEVEGKRQWLLFDKYYTMRSFSHETKDSILERWIKKFGLIKSLHAVGILDGYAAQYVVNTVQCGLINYK